MQTWTTKPRGQQKGFSARYLTPDELSGYLSQPGRVSRLEPTTRSYSIITVDAAGNQERFRMLEGHGSILWENVTEV